MDFKPSKILLPTDFREESCSALKYAIERAKENNAYLYILHTFRLVDLAENMDVLLAKKIMETEAKAKFENLERELLKPAKIRYQFLNDVGFLSDRIVKNVKEHDIDMVLLSEHIDKRMEKVYSDINDLQHSLNCHVEVVPRMVKH